MLQDTTPEEHLNLLIYLENYLGKVLASYEEFMLGGKTYYFSPGGFLYRKDSGSEEEGGYFCGYLDDEVWQYLKKVQRSRYCFLPTTDRDSPSCR
jgi:hypothetical protein